MEESDLQSIAREMKAWFEDGCCQKELQPSLLGLDWSSFGTRKFTEDRNDVRFGNPPEFIYYAFSALDAYATAMLAADIPSDSFGAVDFVCKLTQSDPQSGLHLNFETTAQRAKLDSERVMLELLNSFPLLLESKQVDGGAILFLEVDGCPMTCSYPGRMKSSVSRFLRDRSTDLWPEATLTLAPNTELRMRARKIVKFLHDSESTASDPN
jgi:hypothetical protein